MGTIIAALELGKPLLMLPRLAAFRESRNDNQVGTARHFGTFAQFEVVESASEIGARVDHILANLDSFRVPSHETGPTDSLITAIRDFVSS